MKSAPAFTNVEVVGIPINLPMELDGFATEDKFRYVNVYQRRGKRRNESSSTNDKKVKKESLPLSVTESYFVKITRAALKCGEFHLSILLKWLSSEYFLWNYGVGIYTSNDHEPSVKRFTNGFLSLKKNGLGLRIFGKRWEMILENYESRYSSANLEGGLLNNIKLLRKDAHAYFESKKKHHELSGKFAVRNRQVQKIDGKWARLHDGKFLVTEDVEERPMPKHCTPLWKQVSERFHVMNVGANIEVWMDGDQVIGGRAVGKLTSANSTFVASYIKSLFHMKYVVSRSKIRESIGETMLAVGPLINYRSKSKGKYITFYKNKLKLNKRTPLNSEILELLYEQSSHRLLFEILLVLFAQNFWPALASLLDIQFPFTKLDKVHEQFFSQDACHFKNGIPSYLLFVTKNYCNMVHRDKDRSPFKLSLVSNPNHDPIGGYFVIVDYGIKIPLLDGDIFFFRGCDRHATSLRCNVTDPVYLIATTINEKLGKHFDLVNKEL